MLLSQHVRMDFGGGLIPFAIINHYLAPVMGIPTKWRTKIVIPTAKGVNLPGPYSVPDR